MVGASSVEEQAPILINSLATSDLSTDFVKEPLSGNAAISSGEFWRHDCSTEVIVIVENK